jgi:hypothetical protein
MLHTLYKFLFNAHIYSTRVFNINLSLFSQFILSYNINLYVSWDLSFFKEHNCVFNRNHYARASKRAQFRKLIV